MAPAARMADPLDLPVDPELVHDLAQMLDAHLRRERAEVIRFVAAVRFHATEDGDGVFAQPLHGIVPARMMRIPFRLLILTAGAAFWPGWERTDEVCPQGDFHRVVLPRVRGPRRSYNDAPPCSSALVSASVRTRLKPPSAPVAWARCIARATPGSIAPSRSKCCWPRSAARPTCARASAARPAPSRR